MLEFALRFFMAIAFGEYICMWVGVPRKVSVSGCSLEGYYILGLGLAGCGWQGSVWVMRLP
jgi:hypothetical protein